MLSTPRRGSSGSLAKFAAIRRASSRVSLLLADRGEAALCLKAGEKRKCETSLTYSGFAAPAQHPKLK